jgi:Tol biopolymer transport system component
VSTADINGGNPEGNREVYLFNSTTGIITQITDETAGGSLGSSINADGTRIAFNSNANINGGNPEGNREIYLFDITTGIFTQITDETVGSSALQSINADGTRTTFNSSANINGGNPEGNLEIYLFDTTTGIITQITDETAGNSFASSINADGMRITFTSTANINGGNPEGNSEIYLFDTTTGIFTQITDETAANSTVSSINTDGTRIAFQSRANINGGNPDGNDEIYLAVCLDPTTARNIPTLSEWGLIAMAGVLGIIGLFAIRRRKAAAV